MDRSEREYTWKYKENHGNCRINKKYQAQPWKEVRAVRIIGGSARGRQLKTRKGTQTRPTADRIKESLFNIINERLEGASFLDLFAGNGGVGLEALSRGAQRCIFIEKSNQCVKIIKDNLALCGLEANGEVLQRDVLAAVGHLQTNLDKFDIIFLDPPYHSPALMPVVTRIASAALLATEGVMIVEHHFRDNAWWQPEQWQLAREKKYGDTVMTFLVPV
ncbi:MAG: 16S rRNA (guanine(966)-N(2))-methyltransferase RsmD [Firmicutes bacterium]|nr:16S rRNA (guanine(966)-N(2))-methyltransferase RsmD [Bacillota bacterium]